MSVSVNEVANWIEKDIAWLVDEDAGCCTHKLDDSFAICVGWQDGYDPNDSSVIHSKSEPSWAIVAGLKVWTSDDMRTDYDFINYAYDDEGVWDIDISMTNDESSIADAASWLAKSYNELLKTIEKDGLIVEDDGKVVSVYDIVKDGVQDFIDYYDGWDELDFEDKVDALADKISDLADDADIWLGWRECDELARKFLSGSKNESYNRRGRRRMTEANIRRFYELSPSAGAKSFYGKAKVAEFDDGSYGLYSYDTLVSTAKDGKVTHLGKYSQTTSRHQKEFEKQFSESLKEEKTPYGDTTIEDYVEMNFNGSKEDKQAFIDAMKKRATGGDFFNGLNMSVNGWEKEGKKFGLSMKRNPITESSYTLPYVKWVKRAEDGSWVMWGGSNSADLDPDFLDRINHPNFPNKKYNIENQYVDAIVLPAGKEPMKESKKRGKGKGMRTLKESYDDYNYYEAVKADIEEALEEDYYKEILENATDRDEAYEELYDKLWVEDSVTGNASGSYTFSTYKAEEYICHNLDLLCEAIEEFGGDYKHCMESPETADVTIRCYILGQVLGEILDEYEFGEEEE